MRNRGLLLETAMRASIDFAPTLDAELSFVLARSPGVSELCDLPPVPLREQMAGLFRMGFAQLDFSEPAPPLVEPNRRYYDNPCFLSILLAATILRAAFDARWGSGGFSDPPSVIPHRLAGLDGARLALRMNQYCLGSYRGALLPFIPFVAHLSSAMGARLSAPRLDSPLELWRAVACDRRYIAPRSRFSDFRALPCHLRALASAISEFAVQTSYASWAKTRQFAIHASPSRRQP